MMMEKCKKSFEGKSNITLADFDGLECIGRGSYATVYKARSKDSGTFYAIKQIRKAKVIEQKLEKGLYMEIKIMFSINHPYIIKLYHYFEDEVYLNLVMEFAEGGNLYRILKKIDFLSAIKYFVQLVKAVNYLHTCSPPVIHRDIKAENLLVKEGNLKLTDFGFSSLMADVRTSFCGTLDYMSPEMLRGEEQSTKLDVWALGVMFYELLIHKSPYGPEEPQFMSKDIIDQYKQKIFFEQPKGLEQMPVGAKDLALRMLEKDPRKRITAGEILKHPWLVHMSLEGPDQLLRNSLKNSIVSLNFMEELDMKSSVDHCQIEFELDHNNPKKTNGRSKPIFKFYGDKFLPVSPPTVDVPQVKKANDIEPEAPEFSSEVFRREIGPADKVQEQEKFPETTFNRKPLQSANNYTFFNRKSENSMLSALSETLADPPKSFQDQKLLADPIDTSFQHLAMKNMMGGLSLVKNRLEKQPSTKLIEYQTSDLNELSPVPNINDSQLRSKVSTINNRESLGKIPVSGSVEVSSSSNIRDSQLRSRLRIQKIQEGLEKITAPNSLKNEISEIMGTVQILINEAWGQPGAKNTIKKEFDSIVSKMDSIKKILELGQAVEMEDLISKTKVLAAYFSNQIE